MNVTRLLCTETVVAIVEIGLLSITIALRCRYGIILYCWVTNRKEKMSCQFTFSVCIFTGLSEFRWLNCNSKYINREKTAGSQSSVSSFFIEKNIKPDANNGQKNKTSWKQHCTFLDTNNDCYRTGFLFSIVKIAVVVVAYRCESMKKRMAKLVLMHF